MPELLSLPSLQIREKLQQMMAKRLEMDKKWEDRDDRLRMCECGSGPREPGGVDLYPTWQRRGEGGEDPGAQGLTHLPNSGLQVSGPGRRPLYMLPGSSPSNQYAPLPAHPAPLQTKAC